MRRETIVLFVGVAACASTLPRSLPESSVIDEGDQPVRIALATAARTARLGSAGSWAIYNRNSTNLVARGESGADMTVQVRNGRLVVTRRNGSTTSGQTGPLVVRSLSPGSLLTFDGKRYRGEILISATDTGMLVVNRLGVESYLRGVVPREIGTRRPGEEASVQAQAVAARSYSYIRIGWNANRPFDMYATVQDQVYGGADSETPMADSAIVATRGMVLKYAGRIVNTPYSSTCGGSTAPTSEVWWREPDQPYLRAVSDQIPGTDRYYCDPSPRFRWTATFEREPLRATLQRYLAERGASGGTTSSGAFSSPALTGRLGTLTDVRIDSRTPSGRVAVMTVHTSGGVYTVRGNDTRFVLRTPAGAILNSSNFTLNVERAGGEVTRVTATGRGFGHGIGMCQWGAIGRARAGQDYRTILTTYYPGTEVVPAN